MDSASRIHFFLEPGAADETGALKPDQSKELGINKVGHGLHLADPAFRKYAQSVKVAALARALGWVQISTSTSFLTISHAFPGHTTVPTRVCRVLLGAQTYRVLIGAQL